MQGKESKQSKQISNQKYRVFGSIHFLKDIFKAIQIKLFGISGGEWFIVLLWFFPLGSFQLDTNIYIV